jgi:hypothetical protein
MLRGEADTGDQEPALPGVQQGQQEEDNSDRPKRKRNPPKRFEGYIAQVCSFAIC